MNVLPLTMRPLTRDAPLHRPLKVVASGTLFQVYNLGLPTHSAPGGVARAHSVAHTRGGAASTALSIIAQFPGVEPLLVAPLGGNEEARNVLQHLQKENVNTKYCKIWENAGVPSAWVIQAGEFRSDIVRSLLVNALLVQCRHVGSWISCSVSYYPFHPRKWVYQRMLTMFSLRR